MTDPAEDRVARHRLIGDDDLVPLQVRIARGERLRLVDGAVCDHVIAEASRRFGRLDGLVNNAGLTFTYINPGAEFGKQTPRFCGHWSRTGALL